MNAQGNVPDADVEANVIVTALMAGRISDARLAALLDRERREAAREALSSALAGVTTHNGQPVTPKNLRWAATHEALCRSYIFDVLTGLAGALDREEGNR